MKTLAVISPNTAFATSIRSMVDSGVFTVANHHLADESTIFALADTFDVCLIDAESPGEATTRVIELLRRRAPRCPILVCATSDKISTWEEEAYPLGVAHVLSKPVRQKVLGQLLQRVMPETPLENEESVKIGRTELAPNTAAIETQATVRALEVFRRFSRVLTHSLNSDALLKDFLQLVREIVGLNRAAIFLRPYSHTPENRQNTGESLRLSPACAIGFTQTRLENFTLSLETGIGAHLFHYGRILKRVGPDALTDLQIAREFERLGTQVAIPIHDHETMIGVAVFDYRLTGESLGDAELVLLFQLLEELGAAIKNSREHDLLAANHAIMSDILNELAAGCLVMDRSLALLHANSSLRRFLPQLRNVRHKVELADLPPVIAERIHEALDADLTPAPFKFRPSESSDTVFLITITPFRPPGSTSVNAVLMLMDDFSQIERNQRLEIEASTLRLIKAMAEGLAHEIGNCLVPLATHQQLLRKKIGDPDFILSLDNAMSDGVRRISRLSNQMLFLTRDAVGRSEAILVNQMIEESFREVQAWLNEKNALLVLEGGSRNYRTRGHLPALKHAIFELILNALQANPSEPKIQVKLSSESSSDKQAWLRIDVQDTGAGFTPESSQRAFDPFYSSKNVGLGLGLTVAKKIIETHGGRIELCPDNDRHTVAVFLLLEAHANELQETKSGARATSAVTKGRPTLG